MGHMRPPIFADMEMRTEAEIDNLLLLCPSPKFLELPPFLTQLIQSRKFSLQPEFSSAPQLGCKEVTASCEWCVSDCIARQLIRAMKRSHSQHDLCKML